MNPMQTITQDAATATQTPTPPASITIVAPDGKTLTLPVPRTEAELRQLLAQREELSDQLGSVSARRTELASEIRNRSVEATRGGLEERLRLLDNRIPRPGPALGSTGRQIASAPSDLVAETEPPRPQGGGDDFEEGVMSGGFSVLVFLSIVYFFQRWRRKRRGPGPGAPPLRPSWVVKPPSAWSDWRTEWKRLPSRSNGFRRVSVSLPSCSRSRSLRSRSPPEWDSPYRNARIQRSADSGD